MNEQIRNPGRIDEDAAPIDAANGDLARSRSGTDSANRKPEVVEGPSELIDDESLNVQSEEVVTPEPRGHSLWGFVFWLFSINVFIWMSYEAGLAIAGAWRQSVSIGLFLGGLACMFLAVLFVAGRREYKAMKAVDMLAERGAQMRMAMMSENLPLLRETLEPTLKNLRKRYSTLMEEFEDAAKARETASDYMEQFNNILMPHLDEEANAAIKRSALSGGVMIAFLPHPSLDAAAALWRSTVLARKIGQIYGLEPTGLSSLRLLKYSITTAIVAAGTSFALDLMVEEAVKDGVSSAVKVVGKGSAEGVVTGLRLYRLGNITKKMCRPMVG